MEYETRTEINLASFDGHTFACIAVSQNEDRQRVMLLSKSQLIESLPNSAKPGTVIVRDVHPLQGLSSIKFSRAQFGVIILAFKSGVILQYKVKNAAQCAELIKTNMMAIGISGKVTKSKTLLECIGSAEELLKKTKELEVEFSINPSITLVQELVDGLREVVEKFDAANDNRYALVIKQIQNFLTRSDVIDVLDGKSSTKSAVKPISLPVNSTEAQSHSESKSEGLDLTIKTSVAELVASPTHGEIPESLRLTPRRKPEVKTEPNPQVDELNALLGDITQQFNDLISAIGESSKSPVSQGQEQSVSFEEFDDLFSIPSPLRKDGK
jgi:hypothetical protein